MHHSTLNAHANCCHPSQLTEAHERVSSLEASLTEKASQCTALEEEVASLTTYLNQKVWQSDSQTDG